MRIGVDLGGTKIEVIALSDSGDELYRERITTPRDDYLGTLRVIETLIQNTEKVVGTENTVGIGIPGIVSPITHKVKNANSIWLNDTAIDRDLESILKRPVRVANDANCFTVSEAVDGAGAGSRVVFGVIIGTGCGGGLTIDGQIHAGLDGLAGEWGHNPLPWLTEDEMQYQEKVHCYCGNKGCIELFLSGPGFAKDYEFQCGQQVEPYEIVNLAHIGNEDAVKCLTRYEQRLAKALASLINILDPNVIVLGGGMSKIESLYADVGPLIANWVFGKETITELRPAKYGDSSGVRGAAWLWG